MIKSNTEETPRSIDHRHGSDLSSFEDIGEEKKELSMTFTGKLRLWAKIGNANICFKTRCLFREEDGEILVVCPTTTTELESCGYCITTIHQEAVWRRYHSVIRNDGTCPLPYTIFSFTFIYFSIGYSKYICNFINQFCSYYLKFPDMHII